MIGFNPAVCQERNLAYLYWSQTLLIIISKKKNRFIYQCKFNSCYYTKLVQRSITEPKREIELVRNLKKLSFFKPLLHRHNLVITVFPLVCNHCGYPVRRDLCTSYFPFQCFSLPLCQLKSQRHFGKFAINS